MHGGIAGIETTVGVSTSGKSLNIERLKTALPSTIISPSFEGDVGMLPLYRIMQV